MVRRLVIEDWVDELHWFNRSTDKLEASRVDLEHGLAFAPTCTQVRVHHQSQVSALKDRLDLLVVTAGSRAPGGDRYAVYNSNREFYLRDVAPALRGWDGIVLVVTNPLDLMARCLFRNSGMPGAKVLGLGTIVETARLRAALAGHLLPSRPARAIVGCAVGTHDEHFTPVVPRPGDVGEDEFADIMKMCVREVAEGARRVVDAGKGIEGAQDSTIHPIVEGAVLVLRSVANDCRSELTVSTLDPEDESQMFYSLPCQIGHGGVLARNAGCLEEPVTKDAVERSLDELRKVIESNPD